MTLCRRLSTVPGIVSPLKRNFVTYRPYVPRLQSSHLIVTPFKSRRPFTATLRRSITGQEAPSAQAYIESGVLTRAKDLVTVKKVLVVGSGGLSIGQAGEFDYSGAYRQIALIGNYTPQIQRDPTSRRAALT